MAGRSPRKLENCSGKGIVCSKQRNPPRNRCSANCQPKVWHYLSRRLYGKQSYKIVLADKGLENWKHVEPNDFIISLRSFQGGLEISYIPGCITWHYIVLKPKAGVEPEYFKWLFKSPRYIQALQRTANFIRDGQDLRFSNFVQVPLPLIPMDEQKDIAEYLNKETARIDSIIADITEQIEKLKEYRQSVISEVVTGKVAVE